MQAFCLRTLTPWSFPRTMRPVPNSLHDEAASRLREQIFAGALPPGSFLDEAALCERLAISRTPLREALKVLVRRACCATNRAAAALWLRSPSATWTIFFP